jgi:hypothetical protein
MGRFPSGDEPRRPGRDVDRATPARRHVDPAAVARRLGAAVQWPGAGALRDRSWRLIARTGDFDAWLIAWPGGATAELHDHGSSRGALHVISGSLVETIPWRDDDGSVTLARRDVQPGVTLAFGGGHVHDVRNESAEHALSLHVYSPPLTSMTYYDRSGDRLIPRPDRWDLSREAPYPSARSVLRPAAP